MLYELVSGVPQVICCLFIFFSKHHLKSQHSDAILTGVNGIFPIKPFASSPGPVFAERYA